MAITKSNSQNTITKPKLFEREDNEKQLTDSWQVDAKRAEKWYTNG